MATPVQATSIFSTPSLIDPFEDLDRDLSPRETSASEADLGDGDTSDSDSETFSTPIPRFLTSPCLRDTEQEFLDDIAVWGRDQGFSVFTERSTKKNGVLVRIELRCDRAKRRRERGYLRKTSSSKIATDCPWKIVLAKKKRDGDMWSLAAKSLSHQGHRRSSHWIQHRLYRSYSDEQVAWFEARYLTLKPRQLCELWEQEFGSPIRRRDVYNWIARLRRRDRGGYTDTQSFLQELEEDPEIAWSTISYTDDEDGTTTFRSCAWVFTQQLDIWKKFPDCLTIDATYKTNYLHWPLVLVVAITPERTTVPLFQALLSSERDDIYQWFTGCIATCLETQSIRPPGVIITDGDAQLVRALGINFPGVQLQRCIFHKSKNVIDHIKKHWVRPQLQRILEEFRQRSEAIPTASSRSLVEDCEVENDTTETDTADLDRLRASKATVHTTSRRRDALTQVPNKVANTRSGLYLLWEYMAYSATEEDYQAALSQIDDQFGTMQKKIVEYLRQEDQSRTQWAGYCTNRYLNFGARTTSPNESANGCIKSYGLSAYSSLVALFDITRRFANDRITAFTDSSNSSSERVVLRYLDMPWLGKSALILTGYALDLLVGQHQKMLGEVSCQKSRHQVFAKPLPRCINSFRRQYGLPCAHDLLALFERGDTILVNLDTIHPFWHLDLRRVRLWELASLLLVSVSVLTASMQDRRDPYLRIRAPDPSTARGRPRNEHGPFGNEPSLPSMATMATSAPKTTSRGGIPAGGRRQYSHWELGPELEALDSTDANQLAEMLEPSKDYVGGQFSQPNTTVDVEVEGRSHETVELSHITVAE